MPKLADPTPDATLATRRLLLLTTAGAALLVGLLVYAGRPGSHPALVPWHGVGSGVPLLRALAPWWPSAAHVFAFGLLTVAALPAGAHWRRAACLGWGATNALFELGQHPRIAQRLADALGGQGSWPRAIDLPAYWIQGTFDRADLAACAAGALAAWAVACAIDRSLREKTT